MKFMKNMSKTSKSNMITYAMVIVAFIVLQAWSMSGSMSNLLKGLLVPVCIYSILAVSLNLTVGVLGELSLGHAGFMCVGAFASAFFTACTKTTITNDILRFVIALIIAAAIAGVFGIVIGIPVLRLKGDYLAIVTLAFGEIIKNIINAFYIGLDENGFHFSMKDTMALNMTDNGVVIVKGAQGIIGTPRQSTFVIGTILLLLTLVVVLNLMNSRSGRAIMAIRDNRIAAESVGIDITKYKIMAFAISAALAGVAGCLYAHNISSLTATPKNFGYNMSIMILIYVVMGGMANMRGSIIAASLLTILPELMREFSEYRMLVYAIVLIVMMIFSWSPKVKMWREAHSLKGAFQKKNVKEVK